MRKEATAADFRPIAEIDGRPKAPCNHWALSFFESLDAALERWERLSEREDARTRYGTHVGEIDLTVFDGLMSPPAKEGGHFELHPYEEAPAFAPRVTDYTELQDPDAEEGKGGLRAR